MARILDSTVLPVFRSVAESVVPRAGDFDDDQWRRAVDVVESALSDRAPSVQRRVRLFLRVLDWLPVLRWGRRFRGLTPGRRARVLKALQDARLLLLRRGAWGVRTLALMACYGLPEVRREIGYRAHPRGWAARRVRRCGADPEELEPGPEVQL